MDSAQIIAFIDACILCIVMYLKIKILVIQKEKAMKEAFENERVLLAQSRFASMGKMIASIAHQWRQPLNHLNMIMANLQLAHEKGKLDHYYLQKKAEEADAQLKYMSTTIEDFSNFFANKGKEESFNLKEVCEYAAVLIRSSCQKYEIKLIIESSDTCLHVNYKNELVQIILIILNNAIDALRFNNIQNRYIIITSFCNEILICDNGGGIPKDILPMIFDPYFSTKDKKFGTGLGLYTAKMIMETLIKGHIIALNDSDGACFKLILPTY